MNSEADWGKCKIKFLLSELKIPETFFLTSDFLFQVQVRLILIRTITETLRLLRIKRIASELSQKGPESFLREQHRPNGNLGPWWQVCNIFMQTKKLRLTNWIDNFITMPARAAQDHQI